MKINIIRGNGVCEWWMVFFFFLHLLILVHLFLFIISLYLIRSLAFAHWKWIIEKPKPCNIYKLNNALNYSLFFFFFWKNLILDVFGENAHHYIDLLHPGLCRVSAVHAIHLILHWILSSREFVDFILFLLFFFFYT